MKRELIGVIASAFILFVFLSLFIFHLKSLNNDCEKSTINFYNNNYINQAILSSALHSVTIKIWC